MPEEAGLSDDEHVLADLGETVDHQIVPQVLAPEGERRSTQCLAIETVDGLVALVVRRNPDLIRRNRGNRGSDTRRNLRRT